MNEQELENRIVELRLNGPRLSPNLIDSRIKGVTYTKLPNGKCCVCEMTLQNGFVVLGDASCVSPENYNDEIAQRVSYEKARDKIWELEGYLLQEDCFQKAQR
jgi:hypothetical protein